MRDPVGFVRSMFPGNLHDRIFLVGGVVRDLVLGEEGEDLDLAAAVPVEALSACGFRYVDSRSAAPIHFLHAPPYGKVEVTRLDSVADLAADLRRRDFTANAMAMDLSGSLIDPLSGRADAEARRLRPCSPAAFLDDPARILRAFRLEAGGWRMTDGAGSLIRESVRTVPDLFDPIPVERFSGEMRKALAAPDPGRFFRRIGEFGMGETLLPERFGPRTGCGSDPPETAIRRLDLAAERSPDPLVRFCATFCDLGAGPAAARLCDRLRLPAAWRRALSGACHARPGALRWGSLDDPARIRVAMRAVAAGIDGFLPVLVRSEPDGDGGALPEWEAVVRSARLTAAGLGVAREELDRMPAEARAPYLLRRRVEALQEGR